MVIIQNLIIYAAENVIIHLFIVKVWKLRLLSRKNKSSNSKQNSFFAQYKNIEKYQALQAKYHMCKGFDKISHLRGLTQKSHKRKSRSKAYLLDIL